MISTAYEFVRLRQSELPDEYGRAANDEASIHVWAEVIELYPEMREWVAHNKTVPISILDVLSLYSDLRVRVAVAMKRKLSPEIFDRLARDPSEDVRATIARNPKASVDLLKMLTMDDSLLVSSVAQSRIAQ